MRLVSAALLVITLALSACKKNTSSPGGNFNPESFTRVQGRNLLDSNGNTLLLRGVAFSNHVWGPAEVPQAHHNEEDFVRLKMMHMNAIRFYLNYKTFESDNNPYSYKETGWDWIDKNVQWAKKHGIYLVLNMHYPQGGYQSQGKGDALWNNSEDQKRLIALWAEIAKRYKDEPAIAGYGIVNEPVPVLSLQQWEQLAQRIIDGIRKEDKHHVVFVEKPIWVKNSPEENADLNFPVVSDNNFMYEFHFYDPHAYTHQLLSWANTGDGGKYPDETVVSLANGTWYTATFNNPKLPAGTNDWAYFEGEKYSIADTKIKVGVPALVASGVQGTVYYDNIIIKEFDASDNFTGNILEMDLDTRDGWSYWSRNNSGSSDVSTTTGKDDNTSISLTECTGDCNVTNYSKAFVPKQGYKYQISGWMKGENVSQNASCELRIDFLTSDQSVYGRNKEFLKSILKKYAEFAERKNVPVYMGEFGAGSPCFENNKGGIQWVSDMLDIASEYGFHFTYHSYHESSFGLYFGDNDLPDPNNANQELIELFTEKLR